ncbi:MAG TPA: glycine oxidase ThiO [Gemmatimonadales bacterium]|nr:glycine oxidase ThiO [Gemmatimonadales bacterium]
MAENYDVIVVGGGPVGAACARELALAGRRVLVLEPGGDMGQGWRAAAGMLAPQIEAHDESPLLELGLAGRELYSPLSAALRETTGIDVGLWREGIAWVAAGDTEAAELRSKCAWQRQHGHLSDWLDADEVRARWPWLGPTSGALWAPREGALEPEKLVAGLLADAQRLGATVASDAVVGLDQRGDRLVGVIGRSARYGAPDVVLAAGAWTGTVEAVPRPVAVAPVRGQMAALPWPEGARRGIVYGHGCYLVARGDEAIAGSTMEYVGFRSETTAAGLARIFAGVTALCPTLTSAMVRRTWAGLRPTTPDGLPIIGAEPRLPGLWYATGHGRNGILLAGITGLIVAQLLAGEPTVEEIDAYAPARFWSW